MGDTDQDKTGDGQTQTGAGDGSQGDQGAGQSGQASGQQGGQGDGQSSHTPATQAKGVALKLSQDQIDRLLKDGTLEIADELFTGAVDKRIAQLTSRAKTAEKKLGEISAAQEESERKSLEEQKKFKELYEKERQAREKETAARKDDLIRSRFLLAATKAGVVDPDVAFVIAKSLPGFGAVQVDDDGKVSGVDDLVKVLVEEKPYLISQQRDTKKQSVGSASNPGQQSAPAPKNLAAAGDQFERAVRAGV